MSNLKAYKYRLYPNKKQAETLQWTLDRAREFYNKAECAGSRVLLVSPKYTSQKCSGCGAIVQKELEERWHECSCGCSLDRDHNGALNILRLGLQATKTLSRARTERSEDAPLRSPRL